MKALTALVGMVLTAFVANAAAPPAPDASLGWPTNQVVLENVAVVMPVGSFNNVKVYAPDVAKQKGVQITWEEVAVPDLAGYTVKWGDVLGTDTNSFIVGTSTNIIFYSLDPATTYFFYVVAANTAAEESPPSSVIIFQPGG